MKKNKEITEPSFEAEKAQRAIIKNTKEKVQVRNITFNIGGIYYDTLDKITDILLEEKDEHKVTAKCAAAIYLNGYFRLRLFYWMVWRWFYYGKQLTEDEIAPAVALLKKKVELQRQAYLLNIIFLTDVRTTTMQMKREEAKHIRQELHGATAGQASVDHKGAASGHTL